MPALRRNKEQIFIRDIFSHTNMPYAGLKWSKIKKKPLSVYATPTSHFMDMQTVPISVFPQIRWSKSIIIIVVYLSDCAETLHFCPQTDSIYNFYKILFQIWRLMKMDYYFHFHIYMHVWLFVMTIFYFTQINKYCWTQKYHFCLSLSPIQPIGLNLIQALTAH
jgi:hypothetical protein